MGPLASAIGQGTTKTGSWAAASPARDRERIAALQRGIDLGLTLIDTAELYGGGHAEDLVGRAVADRRDRVFLASKFNPAHSTCAALLAAADASLRRLRTDYLDLYQVHWPEPRVPFEETVAALTRLVADGKVRSVGLGNMTVGQLEHARRVASGLPLVSVQGEYSLWQRACEDDVLPYCEAAGLTFLAYSVLDRGAAVGDGPRRQALEAVALRHACTVSQLMVAWVLGRPGVIALVKAARHRHVEDNAAALAIALTPDDRAQLDAAFQQEVLRVAPARIRVRSAHNPEAYGSVEEARANARDLVPAPVSVAASVAAGHVLKPLPLSPPDVGRDGGAYTLLDGEVLYWGWVMARGMEEPMPAFVRDGAPAAGGGAR
jgi:aryl-alcohol dehydrogenase-like predicted oxidoreductase